MKKFISIMALLAFTAAFAQPQGGGNGQRGPGGQPPQEAISACDGQEEGASCSFDTPRGDTAEGTCQNTPDGEYFACKPTDHPQR